MGPKRSLNRGRITCLIRPGKRFCKQSAYQPEKSRVPTRKIMSLLEKKGGKTPRSLEQRLGGGPSSPRFLLKQDGFSLLDDPDLRRQNVRSGFAGRVAGIIGRDRCCISAEVNVVGSHTGAEIASVFRPCSRTWHQLAGSYLGKIWSGLSRMTPA